MPKYFSVLIHTLCFVLFALTLQAQKSRNDVVAGSWVIVSGSNKIAKKWSIPVVGIIRDYDFFEQYELGFLRTGITYVIKSNIEGTFGYGFLDSDGFLENEEGTTQHWLYQEFYLKPTPDGLPLSHRYRWESRWINKNNKTNLKHRIRYRLRWVQAVNKHFYTTVFNEIFISLQEPTFNQNRFHMGIGYKLFNCIKVELGYLKNHFIRVHYDRIRIGILFKTDFTSKKNK